MALAILVEHNSLADPLLPAPFVPTSVFTGFQLSAYWSATAAINQERAWGVGFGSSG